MMLLRLLLAALAAAAGLVVFTQVPAVACSCAVADTAQHVDAAAVIFVGTLTEIEQTSPDGDDEVSSGDPVFYTFDVGQTFKGDSAGGVVESVRDGATCGLEGMVVDQTYVVFAGESTSGGLDANLCGGTSVASAQLITDVERALNSPAEPPTPTATDVPTPVPPVPTQVPSGLPRASSGKGDEAWAWLGAGVVLAVVGGAAALRPRTR